MENSCIVTVGLYTVKYFVRKSSWKECLIYQLPRCITNTPRLDLIDYHTYCEMLSQPQRQVSVQSVIPFCLFADKQVVWPTAFPLWWPADTLYFHLKHLSISPHCMLNTNKLCHNTFLPRYLWAYNNSVMSFSTPYSLFFNCLGYLLYRGVVGIFHLINTIKFCETWHWNRYWRDDWISEAYKTSPVHSLNQWTEKKPIKEQYWSIRTFS